MKKKLIYGLFCPNTKWRKLLLTMKITAFLLFCGVLNLIAGSSYSQNTKISLDMKDATVENVLNRIEDESEFYFLFNHELINVERRIDVFANNQPIKEILEGIFTDEVSFIVSDRQIVLTPNPVMNEPDGSLSQQLTLTGTVKDASNGDPMPGVNIVIKGTITGTLSDIEGRYTLPVSNPGSAIMVFSFVGYKTVEIPLGNRTTLDVALDPDITGLDEVVVIGYGTVQKKDLTGSVGQVSASTIKDLSVARVDQALSGKIAGVQIMNTTGEPGEAPAIRIRGVGSISAGSEPLYVVDGYPVDNIQFINPNDIETLDVLKDASATAIYGSRGANGVVIISTKRGKTGTAKIGLDAYYGWQKVLRLPEFLTVEEQAWYYYYGIENQNLDRGYDISGDPLTWNYMVPKTVMDVINGVNTTNVNAFDHIFVTAPQQSYNLSASGGNEGLKYNVSGEYTDQDGIIKSSNFKRYSVRANFDAQLSKRLALKLNLNTAYSTSRDLAHSGGQGDSEGILGSAQTWQYWYPLYNEDGSYFSGYGQDATNNVWNPMAQIDLIKRQSEQIRTLGNLNTEYKISDALKLNVMLGANMNNNHYYSFVPKTPVFARTIADGDDDRSSSLNWITETTLNYTKSFNDHNLTGLLGYTTQKQTGSGNYLRSRDFPNNLVYTLNAVSNIIYQGNSDVSEWSLISYLARLNYNFKNRYYVTASIRSDGSSRFGKDNKYGFFPSAALAWRISDEAFLKDLSFLSDMKLRTSYGETGNNNIGNYAHIATINYESYPLGGNALGGYAPSQFANNLLTWEKQRSFNVGMDVSLFESRLNFNADYFNTTNHNLLLNVYVPLITGFNTSLQNIGEVENKGWEFTLSSRNFVGDFSWTTDFNFSRFKNKVRKLGPEGAPIISTSHITQIGQPMGMFYGYKLDGVFMTQDEVEQGPIYGIGTVAETRVGDLRFEDISGPDGEPDGLINTYDKQIIGTPYPDFYYGMTNTFSYKNVSLVVTLQGSYGNEVMMVNDYLYYTRARYKQLAVNRNYWKSEEEPGDGWNPRPNNSPTGGNRERSNRHIDTGTYLKVNNINLGYSFSEQLARKLYLSALRVYINANNPFMFTKFRLYNPEVSNSTNPLEPGIFNSNYPVAKSLSIGLSATF